MVDGRYWFARYRRPDGRPAKGIVPIAWQGRAVIAGFVAAMAVGGASFILIALLTGSFAPGIAVFAVLAACGAGTFLWASVARCDPNRTAAEHLAERRRQ
jgi:hypothetical protein